MTTQEEAIKSYVELLKSHDWGFEFRKDQALWEQGRNELSVLWFFRRALDADGVIWDTHAPASKHSKEFPK